MNSTQIKKFCKALGVSLFSDNTKGWMQIQCPLAPYKHEKRKDENPSFGIKIKTGRASTAHCLSGETRVVTWGGIFAIKDLVGKSHKVLTEGGVWVEAPFKQYGRQELFKITLSLNGVTREVYATSEHRWFERSNQEPVCTKNLKPKHRLDAVVPSGKVPTPSLEGIRHGIIFGDGNVTPVGHQIILHGPKSKLKRFFGGCLMNPVTWHCCNLEGCERVRITNKGETWKELPSLDSDPSYLAGFIAGWVATDGCVTKTGIVLHNKQKENLEWLRVACLRIGMAVHPTKKWYREGYGGFSDIYGLSFVMSTFPRKMMLRGDKDFPEVKFDRLRWTVVSVEPTNKIEEVYCAEVPGTHSFVLEHNLLTGNCFTCGFGGDLMDLVIELKFYAGKSSGMNLKLAEELAEDDEEGGGLELSYIEDDEEEGDKDETVYFFEQWLDSFPECTKSRAGLAYFESRGVPRWVVEELGIRYDPNEKRVCFPIRNNAGHLVGLHGRSINDKIKPKYRMYTHTYPLKGGSNNPKYWYGEEWVDWDEPVVVVESVFDLTSVYRVYKNVICPLTAEISVKKIKRIQDALYIILMLDSDKAGRKASYKIKKNLPHITIKEIKLPKGEDPGDLSVSQLSKKLNPLLDNVLTGE